MKLKVLSISDTGSHKGWIENKSSLEKFGFDYELLIKPFEFGGQMKHIAKWCEEYTGDCTHIAYSDAWDTVVLSSPQEVIDKFKKHYGYLKMLVSGEKNCYPHPEKAKDYPYIIDASAWRYVNAGNFICEIEFFKELSKKLLPDSHDQVWIRDMYFEHQNKISIDHECRIMQSIGFENSDEFAITRDKRILNRKTGSLPVWIHNQGGQHHVPAWVTDLIQ